MASYSSQSTLHLVYILFNIAAFFRHIYISQVKPVQGKALIFFPSFQDGTMDDRTLHCGRYLQSTFSTYIVQVQCMLRLTINVI
jgi:hypothetical protein